MAKNELTDIVDNFKKQYELKKQVLENEALIEKITAHIHELDSNLYRIKFRNNSLESELEKLKGISKIVIHPIKNNNERKKLLKEIEDLKMEIENTKLQIEEQSKQKESILKDIQQINEKITFLPNCIEEYGNTLVINDKSTGKLDNIDFSDNPSELMVHVTDFYPKNRTILSTYDGNKYGATRVSFNGVNKECETLLHRHTVHFTRNNVVQPTGDGFGNWEQPKYVVLENMEYHSNDNIKNTNVSDSWTYGSIKLSDKSILLVNKDYINELPKEAYEDYEVILYSGNYIKCVQNIISSSIGKLSNTYPDDVSHSQSNENLSETALNRRNLYINYIKDNGYKGKEEISFDANDLRTLFKIMNENRDILRVDSITNKSLKYGVSDKILYFFYTFGFKKNSDGTFSIKNDEEIYNQLCNQDDIDIKELNDIAEVLKVNEKEDTNETQYNEDFLNKLSQMNISDLYKFENQKYAEYFFKNINQNTNSVMGYVTLKANGQFSLVADAYENTQLINLFPNLSIELYNKQGDKCYYKITTPEDMKVNDAYYLINRLCDTVTIESILHEDEMLSNTDVEHTTNMVK